MNREERLNERLKKAGLLLPDEQAAAAPEESPPAPEVAAAPSLSREEQAQLMADRAAQHEKEQQAKRIEALALQHSTIPLEPLSAAQLALDIYEVCRWMQANKSYNALVHDIEKLIRVDGTALRTYWMLDKDPVTLAATEGIIFFAKSSGGKRSKYDNDFYGWGLNKKPILKSEKIGKEVWEWERCWLENYGYLNPAIADEIKSRIAAIEEANKRVVTRRHNYVWLENKTTFQIAQMRAVANIMAMWMWDSRWATLGDEQGDMLAWLRSLWVEQANIMEYELEYRTEGEPQARSSKKKTEAAKLDFRKAAIFLAGGTKELYSEEFIKMIEKAEFPIDFSLDPEALPKQAPEKQPVMRMNSSQLMAEFVRWVTDAQIDPDSFEAEDAGVLKRRISNALTEALEDERKSLARAKGQKVDTTGVGDAEPN